MKIVVDSYAWIEIFLGSEKGTRVKEILTKADEVYTPDVVLAEIARKYFREGIKEASIEKRLLTINETSDIVSIRVNIAIGAAKGFEELKHKAKQKRLRDPSLFDAVVLAFARAFKAKVLTGDDHLKSFSETIWIGD